MFLFVKISAQMENGEFIARCYQQIWPWHLVLSSRFNSKDKVRLSLPEIFPCLLYSFQVFSKTKWLYFVTYFMSYVEVKKEIDLAPFVASVKCLLSSNLNFTPHPTLPMFVLYHHAKLLWIVKWNFWFLDKSVCSHAKMISQSHFILKIPCAENNLRAWKKTHPRKRGCSFYSDSPF